MLIRFLRRRARMSVRLSLQTGFFAYYSGLGMPLPTALVLAVVCGWLLSRMLIR